MRVLKRILIFLFALVVTFNFAACDLDDLFGGDTPEPSPGTTYTLAYHGNGNTGGEVPDPLENIAAGTEVAVADNTGNLERVDTVNDVTYLFDGWNSSADGLGNDYPVGSTFTIEHDMILYAKWTTEDYSERHVTLTEIKIKPVDVGEYISATNYQCDPLYWDDNLKLNSLKINFGATGYEAPGLWLDEDFPVEQGVAYTIDDMEYTDMPVGEYTSFTIDSNSNYFKLPLSTADTFTFGANTFIGIFTKPINTEPAVVPIAKTGGSLSAPTIHEDVYVENGLTQIILTSEGLTLNEAGLHSFDMQFVFQINRGEIPQEEYYNVTYDGNGATENVPNDSTDYIHNQTVEVSPQGNMEYDGYIFTGWNTQNDGSGTAYSAEDTFNITEDTTLYAQWVERAEAQIVSIPFKDAILSGSSYDAQTATVLGNMTYGMQHYIYISTNSISQISISDIAQVQVVSSQADIDIVYKKGLSTVIGYDDLFDIPEYDSSPLTFIIEVYQNEELLTGTMLRIREMPF